MGMEMGLCMGMSMGLAMMGLGELMIWMMMRFWKCWYGGQLQHWDDGRG